MNRYDTEVAEGLLQSGGYEVMSLVDGDGEELPGDKGKPAEFAADVILMNTCSVREHAEERVFGRLGMLGKLKRERPGIVVGLMGCMVEEHREKLFRRFPQLDLMVGTRNIKDLPQMVGEVLRNRKQVSQIKQDGISIEYTDQIKRAGKFHAWLPVMTGCNKVCTFCVVPITRGSEVSMPAREVYREASRLVDDGVKWITLLGQNVNSYVAQTSDFRPQTSVQKLKGFASEKVSSLKSEVSGLKDFPALLEMLCEIEGLEKISFTTSHPHDATEELFQVIARNPKISRRFHLPLQSGSDRILKRMKRLHTYTDYRGKISRLRELVPDISITTDLIAGFPGETDDDHRITAQALRELRFDSAYIYKYSVRPGTPAAKLVDDVPSEVKEQRNADLLMIQKQIGEENNRRLLGRIVPVFVEEKNPKVPGQVAGRTEQEKKVAFPGTEDLIGRFVPVLLRDLHRETLTGEMEAVSKTESTSLHMK